jgi:hypothetical protein
VRRKWAICGVLSVWLLALLAWAFAGVCADYAYFAEANVEIPTAARRACASRWRTVVVGMTKRQVEGALGRPARKAVPPPGSSAGGPSRGSLATAHEAAPLECWEYNWIYRGSRTKGYCPYANALVFDEGGRLCRIEGPDRQLSLRFWLFRRSMQTISRTGGDQGAAPTQPPASR